MWAVIYGYIIFLLYHPFDNLPFDSIADLNYLKFFIYFQSGDHLYLLIRQRR